MKTVVCIVWLLEGFSLWGREGVWGEGGGEGVWWGVGGERGRKNCDLI